MPDIRPKLRPRRRACDNDPHNRARTGAGTRHRSVFMGSRPSSMMRPWFSAAGHDQRYLTICGSLAGCGARAPCKHSSLPASARSSFSRRKCCSRDSGDRHIPARRWCSAAIARYSVALSIVSSHASSLRPAGAGTNGVGRLNGSHHLSFGMESPNALRWRFGRIQPAPSPR